MSSKLPGGFKLENWPPAVGVAVVISGLAISGLAISGLAIVYKSEEKERSESNDPLILFSSSAAEGALWTFGTIYFLFFLIHGL